MQAACVWGGCAHLALCEMLGLHDVVKQLPTPTQLHDNVDVVLVLVRALLSTRHGKAHCSKASGMIGTLLKDGQAQHKTVQASAMQRHKAYGILNWQLRLPCNRACSSIQLVLHLPLLLLWLQRDVLHCSARCALAKGRLT